MRRAKRHKHVDGMKGEIETVFFFLRALAIVGTKLLKHIEIIGVNINDFINLEGSFKAQNKKESKVINSEATEVHFAPFLLVYPKLERG